MTASDERGCLMGLVLSGMSELTAEPVFGAREAPAADGVLHGLEAISRVARAAVSIDDLATLAAAVLGEIRTAMRLDVAAIYLAPDGGGSGPMVRLAQRSSPDSVIVARAELVIDQDAWRLMVAGGPLVFRDAATWLTDNPFRPAASHWLALPLVANGTLAGIAVGCSAVSISLDPTAATTLRSLGDVLSASVATARLRRAILRSELDRERIRLAEELHDGLAQDLALAVRELALLETDRAPEQRAASFERLRAAVLSANRVVRAGLEDLSVALPVGGLGPAVRDACDRARERGADVRAQIDDRAEIDGPTAAVALRVLHEALANCARHATGAKVAVRLRTRTGGLLLSVGDRGPGLPSELPRGIGDGHFGIAIMRERARRSGGSLVVRSRRSRGTAVHLRVGPVAHGAV